MQSISYNVCTESHVLLQDDERLKNERVRALKAKERFAQSTAGELDFTFSRRISFYVQDIFFL